MTNLDKLPCKHIVKYIPRDINRIAYKNDFMIL